MGKGLSTGMNRLTEGVWSYLWSQTVKGRKDISSRSGWVDSCVGPHITWLLPPHTSEPYTVCCFQIVSNCHIFFPEQNTDIVCGLVKYVLEFCKNSNVLGFFCIFFCIFFFHILWKSLLNCLPCNSQQMNPLVLQPGFNSSGKVLPFNFVVCSGQKNVHISELVKAF